MATFALIAADFSTDGFNPDNIVSTHRSATAAHKARGKLGALALKRSYVAEKLVNGSYPARVEAMDMPAMRDRDGY